jgi:MOSC domain-containing protein YiiM
MSTPITIHSIYVGQPQSLADEQGSWRSSIYRERVEGPIALGARGLTGDQVTDTHNHGKPDQAVCCHSMAHYDFWAEAYDIQLRPGNVGENWTLTAADEAELCLYDRFQVGTAQVVITSPRVPCSKQARRVGRKDWVDLTLKELRTGFYLSVAQEGMVMDGDEWQLLERPNPGATLYALNRAVYHGDPEAAARFLAMPDLDPYWRKRLEKERA